MNILSMKTIFDVLALLVWVGISTGFVYGLELAGLERFLTKRGYRHHPVVPLPS
jgi:hypothetical protein